MNKRSLKKHQRRQKCSTRRLTPLEYESLEQRKVLTTMLDWGFAPVHNLPQDGEKTILSNLDSAPEITQQPQHGDLTYDAAKRMLTYEADQGFTGEDAFELRGTTEYTIRVWDPTYAVADWAHVRPGQTISIDVLANDYAYQEANQRNDLVQARRQQFEWGSAMFKWQLDVSSLNVVEFSSDSGATVSISDDGRSLDYAAADGFTGTDLVTYVIEDAEGHRSKATVTIEVSNEIAEDRSYFNQSQWVHHQIDSWLNRHINSLTHQSYLYGNAFTVDVTGSSTTFDAANVRFASVATETIEFDTGSSTSDQVANVQEGDIVKSHGDLLYYVTHDSGDGDFTSYLSIVNFSDPADPKVVSTTGFDQRIDDIYLGDDRVAVVLRQGYDSDRFLIPTFSQIHRSIGEADFDLVVLDVSDTTTPSEVYRATIEGRYSEARLIGDELYVVSSNKNTDGPSPWQLMEDSDPNAVPVSPSFYIDAILALGDEGFQLPTIVIESGGESQTIAVGIDQIVKRDDNYSATLISTFDLQSDSGRPVDIDFVESSYVGTVYVSTDAMYLFDGISAIKLDFLDNSGVEFAADGTLEGTLQGQLSADEHEGFLRVAMSDWETGNSVHVLQQVDDSLVIVSSVEDIAPGEHIYSTHFSGDQLFLVTFQKVDPLFVIDLSDPTAIAIEGELKVPGFSNYTQLIGDDLLLAVGREANEDTGLFGALQISLFDVSDSESPQLLDRYVFDGGRSTKTPLVDWIRAAANHHAITFDPITGTLALPIFSQSWQDNAIFDDSASAVSLFEIDRENGIQFSGQIEFETKALRTAVVGDHFVYLSNDALKVAAVADPTVVLSTLVLPTGDENASAAKPFAKADGLECVRDFELEESVAIEETTSGELIEIEPEVEQALIEELSNEQVATDDKTARDESIDSDGLSNEAILSDADALFIGPVSFDVDRSGLQDFSGLDSIELETNELDEFCTRFELAHSSLAGESFDLSGSKSRSLASLSRLDNSDFKTSVATGQSVAGIKADLTTLDGLFSELDGRFADFKA